jgi:hypothetical protein
MSDAILPLGAGAQRTGTFFSILIGRRLLSCCRNSRPAYLGGSGLIEFRTSSQRGYLEVVICGLWLLILAPAPSGKVGRGR